MDMLSCLSSLCPWAAFVEVDLLSCSLTLKRRKAKEQVFGTGFKMPLVVPAPLAKCLVQVPALLLNQLPANTLRDNHVIKFLPHMRDPK